MTEPNAPLPPFAMEAKRFWTSFRPKEAATMSDLDFERIGQQIETDVWEGMQPTILESTRLPEQKRISQIAALQAQLIEVARQEHIYSQGPEAEVQAELDSTPEATLEQLQTQLRQVHLDAVSASQAYSRAEALEDQDGMAQAQSELEQIEVRLQKLQSQLDS